MSLYSKREANYRPSSPGDSRCGECIYFSNNRCSQVSGSINPYYTCDYFEQRDLIQGLEERELVAPRYSYGSRSPHRNGN